MLHSGHSVSKQKAMSYFENLLNALFDSFLEMQVYDLRVKQSHAVTGDPEQSLFQALGPRQAAKPR